MFSSDIAAYLELGNKFGIAVMRLKLKTGESLSCVFLKLEDYEELKKFNVWRIIRRHHFKNWYRHHDLSASTIIDGEFITSITVMD